MTTWKLASQSEAIGHLADFVQSSGWSGEGAPPEFRLEVSEKDCFDDGWLCLGQLWLYPSHARPEATASEDMRERLEDALREGAFTWAVRTQDDMVKDAVELLSGDSNSKKVPSNPVRRALDAVGQAAVRIGLAHPYFDPACIGGMPFRGPTTLVVDTNSVIHGALDFAIRFLHPMVRIKVPAVVHMEVTNQADNFFAARRHASGKKSPSKRAKTLFHHTKSQGGQRALLRLELQRDAGVERPPIGADPLRGIVSLSPDNEEREMGIKELVRSYADRLIHETALRHRERTAASHPVMVLTSDQGLARMALADGLDPLYFQAVGANTAFGRHLTGVVAHPFPRSAPAPLPFHTVALPALLWEMAVTFGAARLSSGAHSYEVAAIGEDLPWSPYHAKDDLLWVRTTETGGTDTPAADSKQKQPNQDEKRPGRDKRKQPAPKEIGPTESRELHGSYRVRAEPLFTLVEKLVTNRVLPDQKGMAIISVKTQRTYREYRNFLEAGGLVDRKDDSIHATDRLDSLWQHWSSRDLQGVLRILRSVESFGQFVDLLSVGSPLDEERAKEAGLHREAVRAYSNLGELVGAAFVYQSGTYTTPSDPPPRDFVGPAMSVFAALRKRQGESHVLTGEWLEQLAVRHGIHPAIARERLEEARTSGLLQRYVEGSSPATGQRSRHINTLVIRKGRPKIEDSDLYDGRFLLTDRAAVRIKLVEGK